MVVYFSGTGNSKFCAEYIAKHLADEVVDAGSYIRDGIAADLVSGKPWIFVSPTYAWQIPAVFADFIRTGGFSGSRDAYFLMTCGGDIGNAGAYLEKLCSETDLAYCGVRPVLMPENYIAMFNAPDPEKAAEIVRNALPVLEAAAGQIARGETFPAQTVKLTDKLKSGPVNKGFNRYYVKANKFYATEVCTGCGVCREACVLNNIAIENGRPVWSDRCIHCMACICTCPQEAVEYGKTSIGKARYRVPQI